MVNDAEAEEGVGCGGACEDSEAEEREDVEMRRLRDVAVEGKLRLLDVLE